ncbi:putative glutathione S-transferase 7 [Ditylenchus destructor]|nr:putative glutathione S-transferase 7 [Ditylenchus destructor]
MVQYKLHYFDTRGIAEPIRLIFTFAHEPFEDIRFKMDDWPSQKSKYKYGKAPVLEVDGKQLAQSSAIARYLAERFGIAGKNAWEKAQLHEIVDFQKDVYTELSPYYYVMLGFKQGDKDALRKDVFLPAAERIFPQYVRLLKESGSGFFAPSGLTYADFIVGDYLEHCLLHTDMRLLAASETTSSELSTSPKGLEFTARNRRNGTSLCVEEMKPNIDLEHIKMETMEDGLKCLTR